jgi:hypothetical protein
MLLDITREEVMTHTHGIIHLVHHVEVQDVELEERAETITNLEQQLLELQVQVPPEPADPEEIDAMSALMRTRSHRCRMQEDKILSGLG